MRTSRLVPMALLGMMCLCGLSLSGCGVSEASEQIARPDVITLAEMALLGELERASVQFPHDLHTDAMAEREEDCTLCHVVQEDGYLSAEYKPLVDAGEQEVMDLYHENCIGCHQEIAAEGAEAGPVACGDCHRRQPAYASSRQPFGFDKSLHFRHIEASNEKCEACHHVYDEAAEKLVYAEGSESSCRDCHRHETEENRSAFQVAAHQACIGCHREPPPEIESESTGPDQCAGCHDREQQLAIEVVEEPPRLNRNQPDFVLVSAAEADLEASKLGTVPFSHVAHEEFTDTCRDCHHETLERCSNCHLLTGSDEAEGVILQQAMHDTMSDHSCVGCHEAKKSAPACAGCHVLMTQAELPERACTICHAGPEPELVESVGARYTSLDDFRPSPSEIRLSFAPSEIPETVSIGLLSNEYEPAVMPHQEIIETLSARIKDSRIATHFHGHEDVVCQGCHHHSPIGAEPPLCESCHSVEFDETKPLKPGLQAAYHLQCLSCHKAMEIEEPKDCVGCHAEKEESAVGS